MNDIDVLEICQVTLDRLQQVQLDHYVALRAHRDRKDMAWEDDRGQLLQALGVAEAKLAESQKALAKLQSKYNRHKETMKVMEESYTELQAQVHQNQRYHATSTSSHVVDSTAPTGTKPRVLKREHSEVDWQQPQQQEGKQQQQQEEEGKLKRIPSARSASAAVAAAFRKGEADKRRRLEEAQQAAVAAAADAAAAAGNKEDYLNEAHPLAFQAGGRYAYPSVFPGSTPATVAAGQTNGEEVSIKKEQLSPTAAAATGGRGSGDGGGGRKSGKAAGRGYDTAAAAAAAPAKVSRSKGAGASSSSSSGDGKKHQQQSKPRESKHVQSNLSKAARAQLPGRTCSECEAFYRMQKAKGVSSQDIRDVLNSCSRHRQQWTPPTTPDGFWDMSAMSMPTPAAVKQRPLDELR